MKYRCIELYYFFLANLKASLFGAYLLTIFLITEYVSFAHISRYDVIFLAAILFQVCSLILKHETIREFSIIMIFHVLATVMELFKTHSAVGSWTYPEVESSIFALYTVPLFSGFLYSAVGSYISRAFKCLHLTFTNFPAQIHILVIAPLIYINFFTHHFIFDIRYLLFIYIFLIFRRTRVLFKVHKKERHMPFLLAAFLTSFFVWLAENVGTFTNIWLYPDQVLGWQIVSLDKMGSWFLLLVFSFAIVSVMYRDRFGGTKKLA
jgi:uncharacterized membrane protein YoaT (DUF817 family)